MSINLFFHPTHLHIEKPTQNGAICSAAERHCHQVDRTRPNKDEKKVEDRESAEKKRKKV